jgi:hypothetical protein
MPKKTEVCGHEEEMNAGIEGEKYEEINKPIKIRQNLYI